ncbi:PfkB family carbohydrate kinase [Xylophilus sp. ASV27]|uniref:PfkB family carbohydrate kinase n=1 Tax=Xylophilus sp. ASV27 TaxID=2795129 RepID=UPI0018ECC22F|nr:PfkB family carbohydrate kinase [Xylophilus sp. ASV27]
MTRPPVIWSVAGTDSAGGAGLAADQRAADACGVHLCTVVAAVTAQHSQGVTHVEPLPAAVLDAQMAALEHDLPPLAVKTGLLGGVAQVQAVARWIDRLRTRGPVALVVDPVLGASTGAAFADAAARAAYRDLLLPRATLTTPNRREALRLTGLPDDAGAPALAHALRQAGAQAVCITGGDDAPVQGLALDWIATPHADGWLALPRIATPHHHGTGCTFASSAAAAMARGFVAADALVLAKMATAQALRHGHAAGQGAGPVCAQPGFISDPSLMPQLSWSAQPRFAPFASTQHPVLGLYAIAASANQLARILAAGVRTVQLRIKTPPRPDAAWPAALRAQVERAVADCRAAGAQFFLNDHRALALELGAPGLHLGQEDLLALNDAERDTLCGERAPALGISSHSLWELARARSLAPRYIACGPVWPTTTKAMPWHPQGLDNLAWWCRMAGAPVVAIGGILTPAQAEAAARRGADGVCIVRGLGDAPEDAVPAFRQALEAGARRSQPGAPVWPRSSLAWVTSGRLPVSG